MCTRTDKFLQVALALTGALFLVIGIAISVLS